MALWCQGSVDSMAADVPVTISLVALSDKKHTKYLFIFFNPDIQIVYQCVAGHFCVCSSNVMSMLHLSNSKFGSQILKLISIDFIGKIITIRRLSHCFIAMRGFVQPAPPKSAGVCWVKLKCHRALVLTHPKV